MALVNQTPGPSFVGPGSSSLEEKSLARRWLEHYSAGFAPMHLQLTDLVHAEQWEISCESPIDHEKTMYVTFVPDNTLSLESFREALHLACQTLGYSLAEEKYGAWDYRRQVEMYAAQNPL